MKNIVMLGGNGYIGRNVIEQWLQRDGQVQFYVLDLFPNQAKVYVFSNLYPCPHPNPPPRGREPLCGRF